MSEPARPLVVTLAIDAAAQARFDAERAELFPPGRTVVGAHVTLFHAVPGELEQAARADIAAVAERPSFPVRVAGVQSLGRGAAYSLESEALAAVHAALRRRWLDQLTAQDRQGFRPHVTVQNKVTPERARATVERLRAAFTPFEVIALGIVLWRYDGGPWTELARHPFRPPA